MGVGRGEELHPGLGSPLRISHPEFMVPVLPSSGSDVRFTPDCLNSGGCLQTPCLCLSSSSDIIYWKQGELFQNKHP